MDLEDAWHDLTHGCNNEECICENLRRLYDVIHVLPDSPEKGGASRLVLDCFVMAKKIVDRLSYYKKAYGDETGNDGGSLRKLPDYHQRKAMRRSRPLLGFPR